MDFVQMALEHGPYLTLAVAAFISAVFPLVNAELVVAGMAVALPDPNLWLLVVVATVAQMAGKCTMYWVGRRATGLHGGKYARAIERWGHRFRGSRKSVGALVFVSSISGLPPFYIISTLAGTFRTSFVTFLLAGSIGRFLHFTAIGLAPMAVRSLAA